MDGSKCQGCEEIAWPMRSFSVNLWLCLLSQFLYPLHKFSISPMSTLTIPSLSSSHWEWCLLCHNVASKFYLVLVYYAVCSWYSFPTLALIHYWKFNSSIYDPWRPFFSDPSILNKKILLLFPPHSRSVVLYYNT